MSEYLRTTKQVVYVAHPVSGDIPANLARAGRWLRYLVDTYDAWAFSAPWVAYVMALNEARYRERGLRDDVEMVKRCDGIVLVGGRLSAGMQLERDTALHAGLWVLDLLRLGEEPRLAGQDGAR